MLTGTPKLLSQLTEALDKLSQQKATGELILSQTEKVATIYLFSGRLLYISDEANRVRRWKRALKQHCPNWVPPTQLSNNQPWEYDLLYQGISKKNLTLNQVKAVVATVAQECLCELVLYKDLHSKWVTTERPKSALSFCIALSLAEIHPVIGHATEIYQQWHGAGLDEIQPSLSPLLKPDVDEQKLPLAKQYLNGKSTIWDLALELKQPVAEVAKMLFGLKQQGILQLQKTADLPTPIADGGVAATPAVATPTPKTPVAPSGQATHQGILIACIDDSPVVGHNLKKILQPAGFQVLNIQEPMAGFGQLIEHKPDLILLDLNMPNANGYSVCKFLRETPVFGNTPIIILTAQDTVIDRARAKLVGATDFISKPPDPVDLLEMIDKYLGTANLAR